MLRRYSSLRMLPWVAAVVVVAAIAAWTTEGSPTTRPVMQDVCEGLTCQCGCGLTVANCNHPTCGFAVPLRVEIERMIGQGMTRAQLIASFRAKYGEKILSAPTTEGFNLLAWITPFLVLAVGGILVVVAIGRWRLPTAPAQPTSAALGANDPLRRELSDEVMRRL